MKLSRLCAVLLLVVGLASCRVSVSPSEPGPDLSPPEVSSFTINGSTGDERNRNIVVLFPSDGNTTASLVATVRDRRNQVALVRIDVFFGDETTPLKKLDTTNNGDRYLAVWDFSGESSSDLYRFSIYTVDTVGNSALITPEISAAILPGSN
ncbi:MAG: hypothetical protein U5L04_00645 [Trueperaceae bacterium]|nr:hypothetical protein [Trueperaceae bacterium]